MLPGTAKHWNEIDFVLSEYMSDESQTIENAQLYQQSVAVVSNQVENTVDHGSPTDTESMLTESLASNINTCINTVVSTNEVTEKNRQSVSRDFLNLIMLLMSI